MLGEGASRAGSSIRKTSTAQQLRCPKPAGELVALVNHDRADGFLDVLRERFPDITFIHCSDYDRLPVILDSERPDCMLSFRMGHKGEFPRKLLVEAPSLKWLHATGAGIEHLPPWDPNSLMVTNSSGLHADIMAEHATWAVLNQTLQIPLYQKQQKEHVWKRYPVRSVADQTIVIVGMGRVGERVAQCLRTFGARVIGVRRHPVDSDAADQTMAMDRLPEALAQADVFILITPLTSETRGLFDREMLSRLKPGAHFVNLARGGIVDEQALRDMLESGALASATLDVFDKEPLPEDDPLWETERVIITPHASGELADWEYHAAMLFADNLTRWTEGADLQNLCDPQLGY